MSIRDYYIILQDIGKPSDHMTFKEIEISLNQEIEQYSTELNQHDKN